MCEYRENVNMKKRVKCKNRRNNFFIIFRVGTGVGVGVVIGFAVGVGVAVGDLVGVVLASLLQSVLALG